MEQHKQTLFDLDHDALRDLVVPWGEPPYRAAQIWTNAYRRLAASYDEMTDLPSAMRRRLAKELPFPAVEELTQQHALDGLTRKALLRLADGKLVETVLMQYERS